MQQTGGHWPGVELSLIHIYGGRRPLKVDLTRPRILASAGFSSPQTLSPSAEHRNEKGLRRSYTSVDLMHPNHTEIMIENEILHTRNALRPDSILCRPYKVMSS